MASEEQTGNKRMPTLTDDSKNEENETCQKNVAAACLAGGDSTKGETKPSVNIPSSPSKTQHDGAVKATPSPKKTPVHGAGGQQPFNLLRFPLRVGITWKKGERLEAMDFSKTWYPSKIVEIDEGEKCVLIHFEGWNSRYDEWVAMDSDKLRPQTRHSERKEKNMKKCRNFPQPCAQQDIFRPGEGVMARWTDCKKYPAKISRLMPDGTFEVVFYDGVTRRVQPINIQPLPEDWKHAAENIQVPGSTTQSSDIASQSSFKNVKLQLPDAVVKRSKLDTQVCCLSMKKFPCVERKNRHMEKSIKKSLAHISGSFKKSPLKGHRFKALQGSSKKTFKKLGSPASTHQSSSSPSCISASTKTFDATGNVPVEAAGAVVSSSMTGNLKMVLKIGQVNAVSSESVASLDGIQNASQMALLSGSKRVKKRSNTDSSLSPRKKRRHKRLKEAGLVPKGHAVSGVQRSYSLDLGASSSSATVVSPHANLAPQFFVPSKAFVVEEDHNPYKCPFEACTKEFRKENLLAYHIKYYHTNTDNSSSGLSSSSATSASLIPASVPLPSSSLSGPFSPSVISPLVPLVSPVSSHTNLTAVPGRRRRRKTDSFCSTDSDASVSSKGKSSSKRQRHDSEISVTGSPDLLSRDLWADVKLKSAQDSLLEDFGETEEEDVDTDLVNCICQIRETNGLMIQCDVCMCWQHFTCVDTEGTGRPPANYVCLACERPKGVRDSCRYVYDMGWEKRGELPNFPFFAENAGKNTERLKRIANDSIPLTSALLGIKAVLHSTRRQIKISKEEEEPEFQLWQTDWDNWTKPEEDLTLTPPRSVEAVPSPAPSTFMFPPAQNSPPVPNTSGTAELGTQPNHPPHHHMELIESDAAGNLSTSTQCQSNHQTPPAELDQASSAPRPSLTNTQCQSSPLTPPMNLGGQAVALPQTPSSVRSSSRLLSSATDGRGNDLIQDLFAPGPAGDAPSLSCCDEGFEGNRGAGQEHSNLLVSDSQTSVQSSASSSSLPASSSSSLVSSQLTSHSLFSSANNNETSTTTTTTNVSPSNKDGSVENPLGSPLLPSSRLPQGSITPTVELNGVEKDGRGKEEEGEMEMKSLSERTGEPLSELYVDVNSGDNELNVDDAEDDNDTDTAEESVEPYRDCERNLLVHISRTHTKIETQLEEFEKQIEELENADLSDPTIQLSGENILNDVPALKKSLGKLVRCLGKIRHLSMYR